MNFFGHAVVAGELAAAPEVTFGAMLPDLSAMAGSKAGNAASEPVARGMTLHHVTDAAFHDGLHFQTHQEQAQTFLHALQLRRGPRRAVAHVGVELILDAALNTPERLGHYRHALHAGVRMVAGRHPEGMNLSLLDRMRLRSLLETLLLRIAHVTPGSPAGVVERLERVVRPRPLLRLDSSELPHVTAWAHAAWRPIHDQAETWLEALTQQISGQMSAAHPLVAPARRNPC